MVLKCFAALFHCRQAVMTAATFQMEENSVKQQPYYLTVRLSILLILVVLTWSFAPASSSKVSQPQECSKCEGKCQSWVDKCKEGSQYACYKAAACLCKCNLDAGGCGSSKEALQECYEKNEKLAKELSPLELQRER